MKNRIGKYNKHYYTGNHLSSTQLVTDGTGVAVQQVEYAPFGEVVNEYNIDWSNGQVPDFKFNGKELDEENGLYYFEARYQSPPVFISRDPLFEEKHFMSPYAYCSNSPVNRVDPSGMLDGWVEDAEGNVSWDNNTNSPAEFETNYTNSGKTGYKYVSDVDNPKSYTLPNGEGQLIMNTWMTANDIVEGLGGLYINLSFIPTDINGEIGWTQTYSSNIPELNSGNLNYTLPATDIATEVVDNNATNPYDPGQLQYFLDNRYKGTLIDMPQRAKKAGAQYDVTFNAQSTVLLNGNRILSVGWGFTVTSETTQTVNAPTILKSTTEFHNRAVQSLRNRILSQ
jgi:RHS repeat-associated protein